MLGDKLLQRFTKEQINTALTAKRWHKTGIKLKKGQVSEIVDLSFAAELHSQYGLPVFKIAMLYDVAESSLRTLFNRHGIQTRGHHTAKNDTNQYFHHIDSNDKAYFLGLITADGSINGSKQQVQLSLIEEDKYILHEFCKAAALNTQVRINVRSLPKKSDAYISFVSHQMVSDLEKYDIVPNKSQCNITFPSLDNKYMWHYIRGYFDGNGIAYSNGNIGFCGCQSLVTGIRDYIVKTCNVDSVTVTYNTMNHIYYVTWGNRYTCYRIFQEMYDNHNNLFLKRKRNKIINGLKPRGIEIC